MFNRSRFMSLQRKISILVITLSCIPLILIGTASYLISNHVLEEKVVSADRNHMEQVGLNMSFITDYVHDTSLFLIQSDEVRSFLMKERSTGGEATIEKTKLERFFLHLTNMKEFIHSIYIEGANGMSFSSIPEAYPLEGDVLAQVKQLKGKSMWTVQRLGKHEVLSYTRELRDINDVEQSLGYMQIHVDLNYINRLLEAQRIGQHDRLYLLDEQQRIMAATDASLLNSRLSEQLEQKQDAESNDGYYTAKLDHERMSIIYYQMDSPSWRIMHVVPLSELVAKNGMISYLVLFAVILLIPLCIFIAMRFTQRFIRPLKLLRNQMAHVEKGQFQGRVQIETNDEVALLGRSFNRMNERLEELVHQVYESEVKKKEAELKALQAQIHPHFLYNTLDTIYWMSRMEHAYETSELVQALSKLFRLSLNGGREMTTVRTEVDHLKYYIVIQQKRYEEMIDFKLDVDDPETLSGSTIKLILQPFVENAIIHGIEQGGHPGAIEVEVWREQDKLMYRISDTGSGFELAEMERQLHEAGANNKGFAIKNVNDRIQLYYGQDYGIVFRNREAGGAIVEISQPWRVENNNESS